MTQEKLQKLVTFVAANRPQWKWIVEGDTIRVCTGQFVTSWDIFRQIEAMNDYLIYEVIDHSTLGQVVCFKPVATGT